MKKFFAMLLALAMMFSFAACGTTAAEPTTPAEEVKHVEGTMEELLNKVVEIEPVEFMGMAMTLDLSDLEGLYYNTGLDSAENITEAAMFGPMMGSIAYSMVMVRTAEGADIKAVAEAMKSGIDTRKWICVEADDLQVVSFTNVVMLIMVGSDTGMTSQSFVDAFQKVCANQFENAELTVY